MKLYALVVLCMFIALYTVVSNREERDRQNGLMRACLKDNAYLPTARQFCKGKMGGCGFQDTSPDCFVRLGSELTPPESLHPNR